MKQQSFWKPVKMKPFKPVTTMPKKYPLKISPKFIQPVRLSIYPSRTKREWKLIDKKPTRDSDRDRVMNWFDCKPLNKKKQGFKHEYSFTDTASKEIKTVKMPPELFLKTTYGEVRRRKNRAPYYNDEDYETYIEHLEKFQSPTKAKEMAAVIKSKKEHLPVPFLTFSEKGKAVGHEGRHTALAAEEAGLEYIPVTIEKPKEAKLTTKYKKLEPVEGKQMEDWHKEIEKAEEEGREWEAPVITEEELK